MMEDDNRVYYRARGSWRVADPGIPLGQTTADGWPLIDRGVVRNSEIIVWRGKILKDTWNAFDREEFLEGIASL
jgi:hypothetical protein